MRHSLRNLRLALIAILVIAPALGRAATLVVTNTADSGPGSLRDAIAIANVNGADDTITFATNLAGQTIKLTSSELQIEEAGNSLTITADGLPGGISISGGGLTGVFFIYGDANVVMESLVVTEGFAANGGGIVSEGNLTLKRCSITRNVARNGDGGGLWQLGGLLIIEHSTFSENLAVKANLDDVRGGGIALFAASADIINTTFSGNAAVAADGNALGGALFQDGGAVSLRHCTFTGNQARGVVSYGGAWVMGGLAAADHSVFADNGAQSGPEIYTGTSSVNSGGYNFLRVGASALGFTNGVNGDRAGTASRPRDPLLGSLQFNGGFTPTHAPLAGSPLIDAAPDSNSGLLTDARGLPRLVDASGSGVARLDIGAVEAGPAVFVTTTADDSDGLHAGGVSLREALANAQIPGTRILFDAASFASPTILLDPVKGPLVVRAGNVSIDATMLPSPVIISGQNSTRILEISNGTVVTLTRVHLVNGRADRGGGLRCAAGATVNLDRCVVSSCLATNGGGAIANAGRLTAHGSSLNANTATHGNGGAIDNASGGRAVFRNSTVSDNSATSGNGGGLHNGPGAEVLLSQCAVQHNTAGRSGGGIFNSATNSAEVSLRHSTVAFNISAQPGGGIANSNVLRATHTLIACNRRGSAPDDFAGSAVSQGYNLLGTSAGAVGFTGLNDLLNVDARLRVIATRAGLAGSLEQDSPAVDGGFNTGGSVVDRLVYFAGLPARDLFGQGRVVNSRADIGAAEFQAAQPFAAGGVPWPVPGRIEAEDFDAGGQGIGYSDTTALNLGDSYRTNEAVDIEVTTDTGGGFNVTAPATGEWLNYTIEVTSPGRYTLLLRAATAAASGTVRVEIDDVDKSGSIVIPDTGGDQDWTTTARTGIELSAGRHVMRLAWESGAANLNWFEWQAEDGERGLTRLLYLARGGALVSDFYPGARGRANFPASPEPFGSTALESGRAGDFETPPDLADSYGVILAGYIAPSVSGYYTFYLCSDNEGELWLSTDENPTNSTLLATEPEGNPGRTWVDGAGRPVVSGRAANVSTNIFLEAGRRYYVEAIAKESNGPDNLAVAWQRAGELAPTNGAPPVASAWLRPLLSREPSLSAAHEFSVGVPRVTPSFQSINPAQPGAFALFRAEAETSGPVTYEWLLNGQPVAGTNFSGTNSSVLKIMNPGPAHAGFYTVTLRGPSDTNTSAPAVLGVQDTASPDTSAPMLIVTSPVPVLVSTTNFVFTFAGTATDNRALLAVLVSGADFTNRLATGASNWSFNANLPVGTNRFSFRAIDQAGNTSALLTRAVVLPNTNRLIVNVTGLGTFAPNLTNAPLFVGRAYRLTATPRPGFVFSHWGGYGSTTSNVLNFVMREGLQLTANFVTNPFAPRKGSYNGLFYQTNEVRHDSSGFITATVTDLGAFSGRITLAGKSVPFSGRFAPSGITQVRMIRRGAATLTMELRLPTDDTDVLIGGLTDGSWVAELLADRAVFLGTNRAPWLGKYTMVLPSSGADATPGGDGFGTPSLAAPGRIAFSGVLADGTVFSQSTTVAKGGAWPFYTPLYAGKGSVIGWLRFVTNNPTESVGGRLNWTKPALPTAKVYPNGFITETLATGSTYTAPGTNRVLTFSNAVVQFSGGGLSPSPLPFHAGLTTANKIVSTNGTAFTMSLTTANGLFSGTFRPPGTNSLLSFRGALLQQTNRGSGFFLNGAAGGAVLFQQAQ